MPSLRTWLSQMRNNPLPAPPPAPVAPQAQQPVGPPRNPIQMHVDDMVMVRRDQISRLFLGTWETVRFGDLSFDTVFRPIGKGIEDNFDYEYTSPYTGPTGMSQQPLVQQTAGVNAGTAGGGSVSNTFKNVMLGLAGLAFILAVGAFALPQLGITLTPGAPQNSGVTIEQVNDTIADGIKPVSDSVASLNENLTEGLAGIGTTLNEAIGGIDSRIDGLEERVNNLASIRDGSVTPTMAPYDPAPACRQDDGTYTDGACPTERPERTPLPTPEPYEPENPDGDIGESFDPFPFYSQSCSPGANCVWDVGAMGSHWNESLQRFVVQVGIVKGVYIEWNGNVATALQADDGRNRCSLMVFGPNQWLENLTIDDANVTIYNIWEGDIDGWSKTLAVQAAQEQAANYGCPLRYNWPDDFDVWGSGISSPPCEVDGFNCGNADPASATVVDDGNRQARNPGNQNANVTPANRSGNNNRAANRNNGNGNLADPTHGSNGKLRKPSADFGGSVAFKKGDSVNGSVIKIGGRTIGPCHYESAPRSGTVIDGVVNYWNDEVRTRRC